MSQIHEMMKYWKRRELERKQREEDERLVQRHDTVHSTDQEKGHNNRE